MLILINNMVACTHLLAWRGALAIIIDQSMVGYKLVDAR
jgi:hypothetical protein